MHVGTDLCSFSPLQKQIYFDYKIKIKIKVKTFICKQNILKSFCLKSKSAFI